MLASPSLGHYRHRGRDDTGAVLVLVWVACGGFAALIANSKGRSVGGFALAGLLLGVIGLLWAAFAKSSAEIGEERAEIVDAARRERDRRDRSARTARRDVKPLHWPE